MFGKLRRLSAFFLIILFALPFLAAPARADLAADGKIVVVIDAGHGGIDGGTAVGTHTEKEYNLKLAQYLAATLEANGNFTVVLTRDTDVYLTYLERVLIARDANADLFLAMHCNSIDYDYVSGTAAYISVVDRFSAAKLAGKILDNISASVPIKRGNVETREDTGDSSGIYYWSEEYQWDMPGAAELRQKSDYYSVNTWSSKFGFPSIIIEHGYLSNANDLSVLDDDGSLWSIAAAEAQAIIDFYTNHEHVYGDVTADFPSNCVFPGTASKHCTICGAKSGTTALPAAPENHWWRTLESREPTCTEDGYIHKLCQISYNLADRDYPIEAHEVEEVLPATGHSYTVIEELPAGHGTDGRITRRCEVCGDITLETLPGEPHTYEVTEEHEPTCTENGVRTERCTVCGDTRTEEIPATGHTYENVEQVNATDEKDGYILWRCSVCGDETTEVLSSCEHEFDVEEIPPTCTEGGSVKSTCTICGYEREEVLPATGHDYEVQTQVEPTCTEDGYRSLKCKVCGDETTETIPATEHLYVTIKEEGGKITKVCAICGDEITERADDARLLASLPNHPVVCVIVGIIVLQLIAVAVILVKHGRKMKK